MVDKILPLTLNQATVRKRCKTIAGPIDLEISGNGLTMIMGPNGSGKTTLLRLMHGLEMAGSGSVNWNIDTQEAQARQAFVFQTPRLLRRSVIENVTYPLKLHKTPIQEASKIAREWLGCVNLTEVSNLNAAFLSGGEKQKLALARALACKPQILFLDEPTANLDGRATREIETILKEALENNIRIVMTTHDSGQAKRLADEMIYLYRGKIHERGSTRQFFSKPKTIEVKAFLRGDIVE